jgi:hypothetical protein
VTSGPEQFPGDGAPAISGDVHFQDDGRTWIYTDQDEWRVLGGGVIVAGTVYNFASLPYGATSGTIYITQDTRTAYMANGRGGWLEVNLLGSAHAQTPTPPTGATSVTGPTGPAGTLGVSKVAQRGTRIFMGYGIDGAVDQYGPNGSRYHRKDPAEGEARVWGTGKDQSIQLYSKVSQHGPLEWRTVTDIQDGDEYVDLATQNVYLLTEKLTQVPAQALPFGAGKI